MTWKLPDRVMLETMDAFGLLKLKTPTNSDDEQIISYNLSYYVAIIVNKSFSWLKCFHFQEELLK